MPNSKCRIAITENPRKLLELQKQYGDVISYSMFGQRFVLLSGADVIRTALQDEALAGRPHIGIAEEITQGWGALLVPSFYGRSERKLFFLRHQYGSRTYSTPHVTHTHPVRLHTSAANIVLHHKSDTSSPKTPLLDTSSGLRTQRGRTGPT